MTGKKFYNTDKYNSYLDFYDTIATQMANLMFVDIGAKERNRNILMRVLLNAHLSDDISQNKEIIAHLKYLDYHRKLQSK